MWQVLVAAAVAGSGLAAKRLLSTNAAEPIAVSQQSEKKCDQPKHPPDFNNSSQRHDSTLFNDDDHDNIADPQSSMSGKESIFRFSSASRSPGRVEDRMGSKNFRRKLGSGSRRIRGNVEGFKNNGGGKVEKKCRFVGVGEEGLAAMDQRKSGKRFAICLKKPRTSKNASAKCQSCSSKDNSIFGWGLGFGIMYMMSAGKAEIKQLNMAMDETAKVVQELKTELCKRKSLHNQHTRSSIAEVKTKPRESRHVQPMVTRSSTDGITAKVSFVSLTEEGESASSVLTEEEQPGALEMYQLESELESELQKLHWCTMDSSVLEEGREDTLETDIPEEEYHRQDGQNLNPCQVGGVLPSELDQKLCHLLIEQQESQIVELETELNQTHSKLHEKEAELRALKDCVRRLTEFSLASISDEEIEAQLGEEHVSNEDHEKKEPISHRPILGIKRAMDIK